MWFQRVLEIADASGVGIGKFRMTMRSDEPIQGPFGLCEHEHESVVDAEQCPEALALAQVYP